MRTPLATALALASSATAAVVAVPTTGASPIAFEILTAPAELKRDETTLSTTTITSTSWTETTVTVFKTSGAVTQTSAFTNPLVEIPGVHNNAAGSETDVTSTIVQTFVATVIAQPVVTDYVSGSASSFAPASAAHWFGQAANVVQDAAGTLRADDLVVPYVEGATGTKVYERDIVTTSSVVTQFTTSFVPAATVTCTVTGSPPPPATGTAFTTLPFTSIPTGVTVTSITSYVTVSANSTSSSPSSTPCNSTSWLNISTFSATGLANATTAVPSAVSTAWWSTSEWLATGWYSSTAYSASATKTGDGIPGFPGAKTSILAGLGSSRFVDLKESNVPMIAAMAMGACFGLALML